MGDLDILASITIVGTGTEQSQVAGQDLENAPYLQRIFDVRPGGSLTMRNVVVNGGDIIGGQGGGIRNQGTLVLENVRISGNIARSGNDPQGTSVQGNGGGLLNTGGGTATLTDVQIDQNQAVGPNGLLAFGGGLANFSGLVTITDSVISTNTATTSGGGITLNQQGAKLTLDHTRVEGNTAGFQGGGIAMGGTGASELNILDRSNIYRNRANGPNGGGLRASSDNLKITIDRSELKENVSLGAGGGISFGGANSSLTIAASSVIQNQANGGNGGGIDAGSNATPNVGQMRITNTTISGNRASNNGGGISSSVAATILNTTIVENVAAAPGPGEHGPGISVTSNTMTLQYSIVAVFRNSGSEDACLGDVTSLGGNVTTGLAFPCGFPNPGDKNGSPNLIGDVGSAFHVPAAGSPAIDIDFRSGCADTDQRGIERPIDGDNDHLSACDAGAIEVDPLPPVNCSPRPKINVSTARNGDGLLRVTFATTGANNTLRQIQVTRNVNGVFGSLPVSGGPQTVFYISRQRPNEPTTISFMITDRCGDWPTFVGGGPNAF